MNKEKLTHTYAIKIRESLYARLGDLSWKHRQQITRQMRGLLTKLMATMEHEEKREASD